MLYDRPNNRVLLEDGRSVVEETAAIEEIINGGQIDGRLMVRPSTDALSYELIYGAPLVFDDKVEPPKVPPQPHSHTQDDIDHLVRLIENSPRFVCTEKYVERLADEIDFFDATGNITFVISLESLISRFREDDVLWGVGRGSACASLVLYVLGVHDIDPVLYDIPFVEMSKESEYS